MLSPAPAPDFTPGSGQRAYPPSAFAPPAHTCEDGLVNPQRGGADFDDADVCWYLVTNCKEKSRAAQPGAGEVVKPQNTQQHHSRTFHSQNKQSFLGYPVQQSWVEACWPTDSHCLPPTRAHVNKKKEEKNTTKPVENCLPAGFLPRRFLARHGSSSCSLIARTQRLSEILRSAQPSLVTIHITLRNAPAWLRPNVSYPRF